jgi:glycosyltransferase involved in cell wall biosynthesis
MPGEHTEVSDPGRLVAGPVVSVLMLAYNHGSWIAEAIESVMAQDCPFPYELIIGEDGSDDETREIALRYQQRHPDRIRVVYPSRNAGVHANHLRVLALARGEFVAYCEGDDYWCRGDKLAAQVALLRADEGAAMVHADWVRAHPREGGWRVGWTRSMHRRLPMQRLQGNLFSLFYFPRILRTCTVMQRRDAVLAFYASPLAVARYRFVDTVRNAYLTSRWRVAYWPEVAAVYRESPGSALRSGRKAFLGFLRSGLAFDSAAREFFRDRPDYPASYRWECAVGLAWASLRLGDRTGLREALGDLRRHYDLRQFMRAGIASLRMRLPAWRTPGRPTDA